jgi:hypothetical protein
LLLIHTQVEKLILKQLKPSSSFLNISLMYPLSNFNQFEYKARDTAFVTGKILGGWTIF